MNSRIWAGALLASGLMLGRTALAEDTDLFVQPAGASGGPPNVLILVDNTANWGRVVGGQAIWINELAAFLTTFNNFPVNADGSAVFRVGLMMFTETGGSNNNVGGGYVRAAVRDMTAVNKTKYMAMFSGLNVLTDRSNGGKAGITMAEAYRYFAGGAPYAGNGKVKTDYTGNSTGSASSLAIYALPGNALDSKNGSPYNSPVGNAACGRNYIIYVSNGAAQDNNSDTSTSTTMLGAAATAEGITGATAQIPISPSGSATNTADEWARFMHRSSLGVVTYTVDVDKITTGQGPGWTALLQSIAGVSSGGYFSVTSGNGGAEIANALGRIFSEIQAVNTVFASVSLPASTDTQGTFANQIFVGMFRPDADAFPRWPGNLKQYRLGILNDELHTLDADGFTAINSSTGFITECARSYWTPSTVDTYWAFKPQGGCLAVANSDASNYPDGNVVEKGGHAYKLRSDTTRTLKTCSPTFASCTSMTDFDTGNAAITQALLGAASATERDALIDFGRGLDTNDEDTDAVTTTEMRPSAHGDVLHSRPIAINYGTDASPLTIVYYGGNDGILRGVNGNRTAVIGSTAAGGEIWSFMAPEFYDKIKRLSDNAPSISYEGATATTPARQPKPVGFDGPMTAYQSGSTVWLYATMRRGARVLYSFDMTEMAVSPANVTLKWKRGCPNLTDDTSCSAGWSGIGQTWSTPKNIKTNGYTSGGSPAPMLVMSGGHDNCEDADPQTCDSSAKGRVVYVLDANDGSILRSFTTDRSVVADVFVVPDTSTGLARYAYVADMGGNIYRISGSSADLPFGATAPANWTMTKIASLGCDTAGDTSPSATCAQNRKFLFAPDVVEKDGVFYLLIGSGDREKPLQAFDSAYAVQNKFFMIKDTPSDTEWLNSETSNCGSAIICLDSLVPIASGGADPDAADLAAMKGWALDMRTHEQVVTGAITVFGTTTFSSHTPVVPAAGSCVSNLGTARVYNVHFQNAAVVAPANNRDGEVTGGGLPPTPVAGMVELDDGTVVPFVIGGDPDSPLESTLPPAPSTGTQPKSITYWYIEK